VITKVVHGWRVGGLVAYLMGPGRAEEHRRPRVVASWDGRDTHWQPQSSGPRDWDLELGPLIRALQAPAVAAGLIWRPVLSRGRVKRCPWPSPWAPLRIAGRDVGLVTSVSACDAMSV
jgi:hypothetical protein